MNRKIVIIILGQPSSNPRTVKEADALSFAGHDVHVLYCFWATWAEKSDKFLLQNVKWNSKLVGGSASTNKFIFNYTRIKNKFFKVLNSIGVNTLGIAERAQTRAYDELLNEAKKLKADWYIGHSLGSLPIAIKAAKYHQTKAGFDFEDYHRGDFQLHEKIETKRAIFLENKYVPHLQYYSTASDLITVLTQKNHSYFKGAVSTILNCFPLTQQPDFTKKSSTDQTLQLFWFSQTIGINRGLDTLANALKILGDAAIHLTLVGNCNEDIREYLEKTLGPLYSNIHFAGIIEPPDLPKFASKYDVGMALELSFPLNRDVCLTNKILTYLLAGNAVILSETSMQIEFNKVYGVGETFQHNNIASLAAKINEYKNIQKLNAQKIHNYQLASSTLNWENESKKLLQIIK